MRHIFFGLLFSFGLSAHAQFSYQQLADMEMKGHQNGMKSLGTNALSNTNIIYDKLELYIDPAINYIQGKVTTRFIPDSAIHFIEFDLSDTLRADSVLYHGQSVLFTHLHNILHISLPVAIAGGVADSVAIFYQGTPDSSGFGAFSHSTHNGVPIIWTLSEPYGASDWWPCKQDLNDKIDSIDIIITTPSAYKAASNGLLTEQTESGSNTIYHWKHRYPIATYLVCMAVTNYRSFTDFVPFGSDTLSVLNYVYPEDYDADTAQSKQIIPMMQLYDSLFGLYPFSKEKYGQVEFNWQGGMEHQTMTFMYNYGFELVSHELAHHWFGDKVTCHSWHDIWLNEGFAVYMTGLCYRYLSPYWYMAFKGDRIHSASTMPHGSVWCDDTTSIARIFDSHLSYAKGAVLLHQLNWLLGDSLFFAGLRNYLTDTTNAYAFGTTASLQRHLEQSSGIDLTWYFNQYIYGKGFPSFQLQWSQDFSRHVTLTIGQTQSDASVPFFQIPVPVQFKSAVGDTLIIFKPTAAGQTYTINLPFMVDSIILDPNLDILSANNTTIRQATGNFLCAVYPNPAVSNLQLQIQTVQACNAVLKIYNLQGQMVYTQNADLQAGANFFNIDIQGLAAGVYALSAVSGKQNTTVSFVVANPPAR